MSRTPMRAYLVSRTDHVNYDEFDAFVVVARDPADALAIVAERWGEYDARQAEAFAAAEVVEVDLTHRGEVLGSFNAG